MTAVRTDYDSLFFGGRWDRSSGSERIPVVSPHSAQVIGSVPSATRAGVDRAVALARQAFDATAWPSLAPAERADGLGHLLAAYAEYKSIFGARPTS